MYNLDAMCRVSHNRLERTKGRICSATIELIYCLNWHLLRSIKATIANQLMMITIERVPVRIACVYV